MVLPAPTVTATPALTSMFGDTDTMIDSDAPADEVSNNMSSVTVEVLSMKLNGDAVLSL